MCIQVSETYDEGSMMATCQALSFFLKHHCTDPSEDDDPSDVYFMTENAIASVSQAAIDSMRGVTKDVLKGWNETIPTFSHKAVRQVP